MDECMNDYDTDGNGEVDYKEFFNVVGRTGSTGMATNKVAKFRAKDKPAEATKRLSTADRQPSPQPVSRPSTPPTASAAKSSKPNPQAVKMLRFIADKVEQKSRNVRVVFRNFDEDKSGSVDTSEFRRGLAHLGIALSDAEFNMLLDIVDNDGSGTIDYNEFVEDLKHLDEQQGNFMGNPDAEKKIVAAHPTAAPRANAASSDVTHHTLGTGRSGQTILAFIADKVEQKSRNVRVVFRNFDEDKSGSVDYDEFRKGLSHLGINLSDGEFKTLLDIVDNDSSGTIDYNEFVEDLKHLDEQQGNFMGNPDAEKKIVAAHPTAAPRANAASSDVTHHTLGTGRSGQTILAFIADKVEQKSRNVRVVFRNFDEDKSGSVDYDEFRKGLSHLGINLSDGEFKTLLDIVDNDSSGTIDYNEVRRNTIRLPLSLCGFRSSSFGRSRTMTASKMARCLQFVEDLKHVDTQQGGFFGSPEASNKLVAKAKQANVVNLSENMFS